MVMVYVDEARCIGCGRCLPACPQGAITLVDGRAQIYQARCTACEACLAACPEKAILSVEEAELATINPLSTPAKRSPQPPALRHPGRLAVVGGALAALGRVALPRLLDWALARLDVSLDKTGGSSRSSDSSTKSASSQRDKRRRRRRGRG